MIKYYRHIQRSLLHYTNQKLPLKAWAEKQWSFPFGQKDTEPLASLRYNMLIEGILS